MKEVEKSAKTVEEAIQLALEELGTSREEIEVDVLSEGRSGILGVGAEEARVIVRPKTAAEPAQPADITGTVKDILEAILSRMGVTASAEHRPEAIVQESEREQAPIIFDIEGEELGLLIGRRGQTLACLQYVVRLIIAHRIEAPALVVIDVNGYKQRRYQTLQTLAEHIAESVVASGEPFTMEPMPAYERRIIHIALVNHPGVTSESTGFGESRKVVIRPMDETGPLPGNRAV
jgi:spoIIIJ-associated protein